MLSLLDLCARIDSGRLTPEGAVGLVREAIAAREPEIGALVCVDPAPAIPTTGPLAGIAVGIKDIIDTADLPTAMGSPIYAGWRPRADAPVVARLKSLGAVPLAKTTTTPFAFLDPTATRNPHHPGHTPGGSSAGSAAAVAAGMLPLALGTQTGGSIIRPAAFCGVVGVKPSFRLLPTVGVKCYSWALDTLGLFAASVPDAAHALALLADRPAIAAHADAGALRIGIVRQDFCAAPDPEAEA
ncbi:amidase family protein, partial [Methylobacterium ajmalii]